MKKIFALALISTATVATLFASGSKETPTKGEETTTEVQATNPAISFLNSKGEIQVALENMAAAYKKETGNEVDILACGAGEVPYTKVTTMYNSGNAPTLSMLDQTDVYALYQSYATDMSNEKWVSEVGSHALSIDGKVYGFPFCIEGRGLIYNGDAIDATLGRHVDIATINTTDKFAALLQELRDNGMESPIVLAKEDWSLGAHQLGYIYDTYDGTTDGATSLMDQLKDGLDPLKTDRFNQFMDTLDLEIKYNYFSADPLGADYDECAMLLADGTSAFWANGSWAWPNIAEGGASTDDNFGFMPFFLGNDPTDFANNQMQASATKVVMLDGKQASPEEQQAGKDFLNWLVFSTTGQKMLVDDAKIIPAAKNNANSPSDPLGKSIVAKLANNGTYPSSFIAPSDHWSVMGSALQKYVAGMSSRAEVAQDVSTYWESQK